ncbi:hypothetical protein Srubr_30130 [Streptomyces rubradiris]|uniref:Uncharacterized protein n=1 Tax=Streptomyces rubradiris TaxID=285531 RepID=A0ABQ3RBD4_STRRR|nr:hypothetical protein GCM10018792_70540 [Streptomyces rubradiris]GHI53167.1 hypothetical protein Srubr_30130 [Streptomyces rubradiris]
MNAKPGQAAATGSSRWASPWASTRPAAGGAKRVPTSRVSVLNGEGGSGGVGELDQAVDAGAGGQRRLTPGWPVRLRRGRGGQGAGKARARDDPHAVGRDVDHRSSGSAHSTDQVGCRLPRCGPFRQASARRAHLTAR